MVSVRRMITENGWTAYLAYTTRIHLYIIDVHLTIVTKLKRAFTFLLSKGIRFIDFGVLRKLAIRFYLWGVSAYFGCAQEIELHPLTVASLVRRVLHNDIRLAVLELTQRQQDNVALVNPHLDAETRSDINKDDDNAHFFAHLSSNMR